MVLGLLDQLHIFSVVSDRIARAFNRFGATLAVALDISKASDRVWLAGLFRLVEFQVIYLALFLLFSVIDGFEWFRMGSLLKNIQLMLEFLKAPFLVLHFPFYTLMTFLMLCNNNFNWLLKLNLIYETLWTGARSGLLSSMLGKLNWFRLTCLITLILLI